MTYPDRVHGPETPEPTPVGELDEQLRHSLDAYHRLRWYGVSALGIVVTIALVIGGVLLARQQSEITSDCAAIRQIATLVPAITPPSKVPSQLVVAYIVNNRNSYAAKGCGMPLPPPSGTLLHWAHYYGLQVPA
jgi:hypothetical protein